MSYENWSARGRSPADSESELAAALVAGDVQTRRDAAVGLVDAAEDGLDTATIEALGERIRIDDDSDVRQFSVEALGVTGAGIDHVRAALEDPDEWVRAEAVVAHSRVRPEDTDPLREALDDDSGWVRRNAVVALSKTGELDQSVLVERIKEDPHPPVREYAAQFLAEYATDTDSAVRILAAVLAREPNAFVRAKAALSLGELATDRAEESLERHGLSDRSENVQRSARRALATARGVDPEEIRLPEPAAPGGGPDYPEEKPPQAERERRPGPGPSGGVGR